MNTSIIIGTLIGVQGDNPIPPVYPNERVTDDDENRYTDDGYERITD